MGFPKLAMYKDDIKALLEQIFAIDPFEGLEANELPELRQLWNTAKNDSNEMLRELDIGMSNAESSWKDGLAKSSQALVDLDPNAGNPEPVYDTQRLNQEMNTREKNVQWRLSQIGRSLRDRLALMELLNDEQEVWHTMLQEENRLKNVSEEIKKAEDGFADYPDAKTLNAAAEKAEQDYQNAAKGFDKVKVDYKIDDSMISPEALKKLKEENDRLLGDKNLAGKDAQDAANAVWEKKNELENQKKNTGARLEKARLDREKMLSDDEKACKAAQEELKNEQEQADAESRKKIRAQEAKITDLRFDVAQMKAQTADRHKETEKSERQLQSSQKELEEEMQAVNASSLELENDLEIQNTAAEKVANADAFFKKLDDEKPDRIAILQETREKNAVIEYRAGYYDSLLNAEDSARTCNEMKDFYADLLYPINAERAKKVLEDGKRFHAMSSEEQKTLGKNEKEALDTYRAYLKDKEKLRGDFGRHEMGKNFDKEFEEKAATLGGLMALGEKLHKLDKEATDNMFIKPEPGKKLTEREQKINEGMQEIANNYTVLKHYSKLQNEIPGKIAELKSELEESNKRLAFLREQNDKLVEKNKQQKELEKQAADALEKKMQALAEAEKKLAELNNEREQTKLDYDEKRKARQEQDKKETEQLTQNSADSLKKLEEKLQADLQKKLAEGEKDLEKLQAAENKAAEKLKKAKADHEKFLDQNKAIQKLIEASKKRKNCKEQTDKMKGLVGRVDELYEKHQKKEEMIKQIQKEYGFTKEDLERQEGIGNNVGYKRIPDRMTVSAAMRKTLLSTLKHYDATADMAKEKDHHDSDEYKRMMEALRGLTANNGAAMDGCTAKEVKEMLKNVAEKAHEYVQAKEDQWFQSFRHSEMRKTRLQFARGLEQFCRSGMDAVMSAQIQKSNARGSMFSISSELLKEPFKTKDEMVGKLHESAKKNIEARKQKQNSAAVNQSKTEKGLSANV